MGVKCVLMERLNEYGKKDLTAYNAAAIMTNANFTIDYGGIKFLGLGGSNMSPDEVVAATNILIKKINPKGSISRKTLYNWEKWGLIPQAIYRDGKTTIMPEETVAEAYATWVLKNGKLRMVVDQIKSERNKIKEVGEGAFIHKYLSTCYYFPPLLSFTMMARVLEQFKVKYGINVASDILIKGVYKTIGNGKHQQTFSLASYIGYEDKIIAQGDFIDIIESIQVMDGEDDSIIQVPYKNIYWGT